MSSLTSLSQIYKEPSDRVLMTRRGRPKTVSDLARESGAVRNFILTHPHEKWLLHSDEYWDTLCALVALLEEGKVPCLVGSLASGYLLEVGGEDGWLLGDEDGSRASSISALSTLPPEGKLSPIDRDAHIILYTSGSTGHPEAVVHTLSDLEEGASLAYKVWPEELGARPFATSAPPYHIFGFLSVLLRGLMGSLVLRSERVMGVSHLSLLHGETFMTTPSFLKLALEDPESGKVDLSNGMIVTSGGRLSPEVAKLCQQRFGTWPYEIYGSTETGSIAWRQSLHGEAWTPFPGIGWSTDVDGRLVLHSPLVNGGKPYVHDDIVQRVDDTHFLLLGRSDSVVKIGEKRVSLVEVEKRILSLGWFDDVAVVALEAKRLFLAALCVQNAKGHEALDRLTSAKRLSLLRTSLSRWLEPIAIPRKWRFAEAIPSNTMGKRKMEEIRKLLAEETYKGVRMGLRAKAENKVELDLVVTADSPFYDGHFDNGVKLLPAVAQIDIVVHVVRTWFEQDFLPLSIPKTKFSSPIKPDQPLVLTVEGKEGSYAFQYKSGEGKLCAKGKVSRV